MWRDIPSTGVTLITFKKRFVTDQKSVFPVWLCFLFYFEIILDLLVANRRSQVVRIASNSRFALVMARADFFEARTAHGQEPLVQ